MKQLYLTLLFLLSFHLPLSVAQERFDRLGSSETARPIAAKLQDTIHKGKISLDPDSLRLSRIDSELAALVERDSTFRREVDVTSGR